MTTRYALIYVYYSLTVNFILFQEHDMSILKVETFLREWKQYDLKCRRVLFIRLPHPAVHKNHGQFQVLTT